MAAVVRNGREVLSNFISSQIDIHTLYGGVVPEIASRKHPERINQVIGEALQEMDAIMFPHAKVADMATSFQKAVVDVLVEYSMQAVEECGMAMI